MNLDLCRSRQLPKNQTRELSVQEKDELGLLEVKWVPATPVPGRVSANLSGTIRFETWRRVA